MPSPPTDFPRHTLATLSRSGSALTVALAMAATLAAAPPTALKDVAPPGLKIGEQGHWGLDDPPLAAVDGVLAAIRASGTRVLVTELDIDVLPRDPDMWGADLSKKARIRAATNIYPDGLPPAVQERLARRYADLFTLFLTHDVGRVTFWGVTDATSWLNDFPIPGRVNYPLLWGRDGREKPCFEAVGEVLRQHAR